jgi:hypothetical protein
MILRTSVGIGKVLDRILTFQPKIVWTWSGEEYLKLLDIRKQAELQWSQN